jgi:hypothetical protein
VTIDRITVRFVRFYAPGSFVAEDWTVPVDTLDPLAIKWPDNAYAFTLHERVDVADGPERFTGEAKQIGPMYYHPDSKVETQAEVALNPKATGILLSNMRCNRWDQIIWSRWGNWPQPYEAGRHLVLVTA